MLIMYGWVHYERLSSIDLYWYYLCYKLRNAECMIHLNLRYACNHFDCLILGFKRIQSMRQAFQGLTPNGSFIYLNCWNLEQIDVLKTPKCFGVENKLSILVSFWTMVLLDRHLIDFRLFAIDFYQRLRNILCILYNLFLW